MVELLLSVTHYSEMLEMISQVPTLKSLAIMDIHKHFKLQVQMELSMELFIGLFMWQQTP